ncbi:MAG: hypothetical protein PHF70_13825, partial [Opitutales bacterium]|nr:hypothetical protein [Opitutales bacterium]
RLACSLKRAGMHLNKRMAIDWDLRFIRKINDLSIELTRLQALRCILPWKSSKSLRRHSLAEVRLKTNRSFFREIIRTGSRPSSLNKASDQSDAEVDTLRRKPSISIPQAYP